MEKPVIGITTNTSLLAGGAPESSKVSIVYEYIRAVVEAGGVPLLLPPLTEEDCRRRQVMAVDGIILSGGGDVYPPLYGEQPSGLVGFVDRLRDEYELMLIEYAVESQKPLLGICRGAQVINIAFGGTLYQDVSLFSGKGVQHTQPSVQKAVWHEVEVTPGTFLAECLQVPMVQTNTSHHQLIKKVAPGFTVNAAAGDGAVEGIEKTDSGFILGLQWHPERMLDQSYMMDIFKGFVQRAKTKC